MNWLVRNGFSFKDALELPDTYRSAFCIVQASFDGRGFDWDRFDFEEVAK